MDNLTELQDISITDPMAFHRVEQPRPWWIMAFPER